MRTLIIDDESKARNLLCNILTDYCPQIGEIEEANDLPSGIKAIHAFKPDLVFLDVEMPGYSGLQLMDFLDKSQMNFEVIFATAYDDYAIQAFDLNAVSYLLKPLRPATVKEAVVKAAERRQKLQISNQLQALRETLQNHSVGKIGLPTADGLLFLKIDEIIFLQAEGMYTRFFTQNDGEFLISKPLKNFVEQLKDRQQFVKTHRSFLINLAFVKKVVKKDGGYLVMDNGSEVSLSRDKQESILQMLKAGFG